MWNRIILTCYTHWIPSYLSSVESLLCRTLLTSILRWSWLIPPTMPSEMTLESTGSAIQSTSTENSEVSPLLERSTEVCAVRVIYTTKHVLLAGLPGRGTILYPSVATGDLLDVLSNFVSAITNLSGEHSSCHFEFFFSEIGKFRTYSLNFTL